jgi:hypothetical protein
VTSADRESVANWRRGWDSNPRLSFPNTRFPSVLLKPLGHLSALVTSDATELQKTNKLTTTQQTAAVSKSDPADSI